MPSIRKNNKHLPPNVYYVDYEQRRKKKNKYRHKGAFYFMPYIIEAHKKKRKKILLGYSYQEAMAKWAQLTEVHFPDKFILMNAVFDKYMTEISPTKAPATHKDEIRKMSNLRTYFGDMLADEVEPQDIYRYMDMRGQTAKVRANREKALLSHVFTKAIRWGVVKTNPCLNVEGFKEIPRSRYVQDWEFIAIRTWERTPPILKVLMGFMYAGGRRRCELLPINIASTMNKEGIKIYDPKAKEWLIWDWDDALRLLYKEALNIPRRIKSFYLFANKYGQPYRSDTLCKMFRKVILEAIEEGIIKEPFVLHDCRAKASSDSPSLQDAFELLNHSSVAITERVYRRKIRHIKTLKDAGVVLNKKDGTQK